MKYPLSFFIAGCVLALGCSKQPAPTTAPSDPAPTATTDGAAGEDQGEASGEDPGDGGVEDGTDAPSDDGAGEDETPTSAGPITDEYGAVAVAANPRAEVTEVSKWASVKIELRTDKGKVHKTSGYAFPYDQLTRVEFDFEGINHIFLLDLGMDGSKASVKMTYLAGGEEVVRNYGFDVKLKKREVLRLDDGTGVALTVSNKTIKPLPAEEREKLKGADGDRDPLSGAL